MSSERCLNVNVGVLGHVDSGKTSIVEQLSTVLSTAALDKHPQSQERGITLDLGFSALKLPAPAWLLNEGQYEQLQFTLVDCPGHASLSKTVLGGAHIMDMMMLVIDVTKGIQVQTAECIVIGELVVEKVLVVLNKIDLLPQDSVEKIVTKAQKRVLQTFKLTSFKDIRIVHVSVPTNIGFDAIREELVSMVDRMPKRKTGPFRFAVDHCFRIKGHGTVLTGTVLQGSVKIQDSVEIPALQEIRRVKSIQVFKKPVSAASAGDRAGICVTDLDPSRLERGLVAAPGSVRTFQAAVITVEKVKFFAQQVSSGQKFQVMIGHTSSVGTFTLFKARNPSNGFRLEDEYQFVEELPREITSPIWATVVFEIPLTSPTELPVVAARLDGSSANSSCRMAMHGRILHTLKPRDLQKMKLFKVKERKGFIKESGTDSKTVVCSGMFKKETDFSFFIGLPVVSEKGHRGKVLQAHGKNGDVLVRFDSEIKVENEDDKGITLYSKKYITP